MAGEDPSRLSGLRRLPGLLGDKLSVSDDISQKPKPEFGPNVATKRYVARGEAKRNTLNYVPKRTGVYAFLYHNEMQGEPAGPWLLRFEAIAVDWFDEYWEEARETREGAALESALATELGGGHFHEGFPKLGEGTRAQLYAAHRHFMEQLSAPDSTAKVYLVEVLVSDQLPQSSLVEGEWFRFDLVEGQEVADFGGLDEPGQAHICEIGRWPGEDGPGRQFRMLESTAVKAVEPGFHAVLQGLHFPQNDPAISPDQLETVSQPEDPEEEDNAPDFFMDEAGRLIVQIGFDQMIIDAASGGPPIHKVARTKRTRGGVAIPAGGGGGGGAPVGRAAIRRALVPPVAGAPPVPMAVIPPPVNGMAHHPGGQQSFVGINAVGQANNIALWDRNGSIIAYVDFGLPTTMNMNTYGPLLGAPMNLQHPCVCTDPIIILSHWDYDHYAMVRWVPDALRRRWIAPQQVFGSIAGRELYVRLLGHAPHGSLQLWPLGVTGQITTPFGYIERGTGAVGVNDNGLVVYVRVCDDPANIPPPTLPMPAYGPRALPPPIGMPGGMVLNTPLVVAPGTAIDWRLHPAIHWDSIVVPVGAFGVGAPVVPAGAPAPGVGVLWVIPVAPPGPGAILMGNWIPPAGIALPAAHGGGQFIVPPVAASPGGWAVNAQTFVALGGWMIAFRAGIVNTCVISPTAPPWIPVVGAAPPLAGFAPLGAGWNPPWGPGPCYEGPIPAAMIAALFPIPAGPGAFAAGAAISPAPAPVHAPERYILLPGDAGFQQIPSQALVNPPDVIGLVATHHGSDSWLPAAGPNRIPPQPGAGGAPTDRIAYSYGTRIGGANNNSHCYIAAGQGHPRPNAIAAYLAQGWGNPAIIPMAGPPFEFHRMNTAPHDFESNQPYDPVPVAAGTAPNLVHAQGHLNCNIALGMDNATGGPILSNLPGVVPPAGVRPRIARACPHRAQNRDFVY